MLSLLATFFTLAPASTSFIDEANTMGVANMGHGFAVSFSDYDADGDPDLYITNSNSTNRLYENDGAGRFMDVTGQAGLLDKDDSRGAVWGDLNGDGRIDLYVGNVDGPNRFWSSDSNELGHFVDGTVDAGLGDTGFAQGLSIADIDGDGALDVFVANFKQSNVLYLNDGAGRFRDVTVNAGLNDTAQSFGVVFLDFDNDNDVDLYVSNSKSANKLYRNDGNAKFTDVTELANVADDGDARGVSAGDLNGDGWLDLYVVNIGPNKLYINQQNGTFTDATAASNVGDTGPAQGVNMADVDGNGALDIFVSNWGKPGLLYMNDGTARFEDNATAAGLADVMCGQGVGFADVNVNGQLDMYVASWGEPPFGASPQANKLYINQGTALPWLKVQPHEKMTGQATLLGTEVRLFEEGTRTQVGGGLRVIDGGSGFGSQNMYEAYFGLGSAALQGKLFDVEVRRVGGEWLNKTVQPGLGSVAANQVVIPVISGGPDSSKCGVPCKDHSDCGGACRVCGAGEAWRGATCGK